MTSSGGSACAMRALKLSAPGRAELLSVPVPRPAPGEVLLRVLAAGLCQTDLHICAASDSRTPPGTTLGHEVAGEVAELDEGVRGFAPGERFAVHPCRACGRCTACLAGRQNYCRDTGGRLNPPPTTGVDVDGGMAEYVSVPATTLVPIGDLDPAVAAVLADAGLTAFHAVRSCADQLRAGSTALIIGVGGLGALAARYVRATSAASVIVADISDAALAASADVADLTLRADATSCRDDVLAAGAGGVDVVLDFVGRDETLELAISVVRRGGAIRMVGLGGGTLPLVARSAGNAVPRGVSITSPYSGSYAEFREVIAMAAAGRVVPRVTRYPLAQAFEAMAALRDGAVVGRAVLIP